ncbi:MAG: cobalamin-binding protein [Chloroflexi bacterium]|nr:MAG: cobalamin-binding protein [Chloroflexota bacterium]
MNETYTNIYEAVIDGDMETTSHEVQVALDAGHPPGEILQDGLIAAMGEVGSLFESGEYFVPEMLIAARAMQGALDILRPHLVEADVQPLGKVVLCTVQGDMHDIGKNLVGMMLEGAGFEVIDLGTDVKAEELIQAVEQNQPDLIGMSALLTTTMPQMSIVIETLQSAGLRDGVKVMVGGAPLTQEYAEHIGADGFAADASQATTLAKQLIS